MKPQRRCWRDPHDHTGAVAVFLFLCLAGLGVRPAGLGAQQGPRWFPDGEAFQPLIAAPREVQLRASLVLAERPDRPEYTGRNIEAEVTIGHRFALLRLGEGSSEKRAASLGFEVGVFSRFFMETSRKDLINVDFKVGAPLAMRNGSWQVRFSLRHISSHLGDDYFARFGDELGQTAKNGFEGLVARTLGKGARFYAGGEVNFLISRTSRYVVRAGLEWDPEGPGSADAIWPFLAADYEYPSLSDRGAATLVGGAGLRVGGRRLRLEARGRFGSSPMGQLRETKESFFGLGLSVIL